MQAADSLGDSAATGTATIALIAGLLIFRRYEDSLIFNL
jgi:hypothetical protein